LDEGRCAYFINGEDLGIHVDFNHRNKMGKRFEDTSSSITSDNDSIASAKTYATDSTTRTEPRKITKVKFGLYPAISLTSNQQVTVNFGERQWLFPPPLLCDYKPYCDSGELDEVYKSKVMKWVATRGASAHGKSYGPKNKPPRRPDAIIGAEEPGSPRQDTESEEEDEAEEEDVCDICCAEPKGVTLMPCQHNGFGVACAAILTTW
jgi:hypothetical protein